LLTGPRQVGKRTLLKKKYGSVPFILLDNNITLTTLKQDPLGFLQLQGTPVILDEIQRAPESFLSIKYMIDSDRHAGMYLLTGSQKYELLKMQATASQAESVSSTCWDCPTAN
jgi:hypothetical protein